MNKIELAEKMSKKLGTTKKNAELAITALTEVITEELVKGEKVSISGFLSMETIDVDARDCRNPKTGVIVSSPAHKKVRISARKTLKDAVNGKKA